MKRTLLASAIALLFLYWAWSFFIHPFSESETKEKVEHHNQMVDDALKQLLAQ